MKKLLIILIILIMPVIISAGIVGQYVIFTSSFPQVALNKMLQYAVDNSKDKRQPSLRVSWISQVSTNTSNNRLIRTDYRNNSPVIDSETKEIYMEIDIGVEGFHPIENFITQGKILKLGYFTFDRKGYNRDLTSEGNIYDAAIRRNKWSYKVVISTP